MYLFTKTLLYFLYKVNLALDKIYLWVYTHNISFRKDFTFIEQFIARKELINMPNKDGTGPEGKGPKTGRCKGRCGGNSDNAKTQDEGGRDMRRNEKNND